MEKQNNRIRRGIIYLVCVILIIFAIVPNILGNPNTLNINIKPTTSAVKVPHSVAAVKKLVSVSRKLPPSLIGLFADNAMLFECVKLYEEASQKYDTVAYAKIWFKRYDGVRVEIHTGITCYAYGKDVFLHQTVIRNAIADEMALVKQVIDNQYRYLEHNICIALYANLRNCTLEDENNIRLFLKGPYVNSSPSGMLENCINGLRSNTYSKDCINKWKLLVGEKNRLQKNAVFYDEMVRLYNRTYRSGTFDESIRTAISYLVFTDNEYRVAKAKLKSSGSRSRAAVKILQSALNRCVGVKLSVDGVAGNQTHLAIKQFQSGSGFGLNPTGVLDRSTFNALNQCVTSS